MSMHVPLAWHARRLVNSIKVTTYGRNSWELSTAQVGYLVSKELAEFFSEGYGGEIEGGKQVYSCVVGNQDSGFAP